MQTVLKEDNSNNYAVIKRDQAFCYCAAKIGRKLMLWVGATNCCAKLFEPFALVSFDALTLHC